MTFENLTNAYMAIHRLREFFQDHSREIDPTIRLDRNSIDPVASLHDLIQDRFYGAWKCYGLKPFIHGGQIVYWDHRKLGVAFVDVVESGDLPDGITTEEPRP